MSAITENHKRACYKSCFVPLCSSTSIRTPEKIFICVPKAKQIRIKWFKAARRGPPESYLTTFYCCEDHFKMEEDIENFIRYKLMGGNVRLYAKVGVIPRFFNCQDDRKRAFRLQPKPTIDKRQRKIMISNNLSSSPHVGCYDTVREAYQLDESMEDLEGFSADTPHCSSALPPKIELTCSKMEIQESLKSPNRSFSDSASPPIKWLVEVKEEPDPSEPVMEGKMCWQENYAEVEPQEREECNVVCVPFEVGELGNVKEEVDLNESLIGDEMCSGERIHEEEPEPEALVVVSLHDGTFDPQIVFKEETHSSDPFSEVKTYWPEKTTEVKPQEYKVVCVPFEMGDLVEDRSTAEGTSERNGSILRSVLCDTRADIKRDSIMREKVFSLGNAPQVLSLGNNSSLPHVFYMGKLGDNVSDTQEEKDLTENCLESAYKSYGMETSEGVNELKYPCEKQCSNWTEYICDCCGIKYSDKIKLSDHFRDQFSSKGASVFEIPEKDISPRCSSFRIVEIKDVLKSHKCHVCGRRFGERNAVLRHLSRFHACSKPFKCETCGANFSSKQYLKQHEVIHSIVKPFKCQTCGKQFTRKSNYETHSLNHIGVKRYKCDICEKEFNQRKHLIQHAIIHTNLKPFKCEVCGKAFARKSNYEYHSLSHSLKKQFRCEICGMGFDRKNNLKVHLQEVCQSDFKPYRCDTCGKEFYRKSNLSNHSYVHSKIKSFSCETCGRKFSRKGCLARHYLTHSVSKQNSLEDVK